ncbi:MAG: hypothetical protein WAU49_16160 [Steroidobacteraceae bacterium]
MRALEQVSGSLENTRAERCQPWRLYGAVQQGCAEGGFQPLDLARYGGRRAVEPGGSSGYRAGLREFNKSIKVSVRVNQRFALKDVAEAHTAMEARATSGSTILIP